MDSFDWRTQRILYLIYTYTWHTLSFPQKFDSFRRLSWNCSIKFYHIWAFQEVNVNGVRFWCYSAGHVLGAAMFMIEIAGVKVSRI